MTTKWIATPTRTKAILEAYDFAFKKSLGQNFIVDASLLNKMVQKADINGQAGVIEVGPGIGALTEQLALSADKVVAYEIDGRLYSILQETLGSYSNVCILQQDILEADVAAMINHYFASDQPVHVVANLPYYITTPILMRLLHANLPVSSLTVMIQKEVADRMAAEPNQKSYGSLSLAVQYYTEAAVVMNVPKNVFMPPPNVDSSVLKLDKRQQAPVNVDDEDYFFTIIQACFAQRRKTIRNNLIRHFKNSVEKRDVVEALKASGIDETRRGESLTMAEFAVLANTCYRLFEKA